MTKGRGPPGGIGVTAETLMTELIRDVIRVDRCTIIAHMAIITLRRRSLELRAVALDAGGRQMRPGERIGGFGAMIERRRFPAIVRMAGQTVLVE